MEHSTSTLIVLKELAGNPPPQLNAIQEFLTPHVGLLTDIWISAFVMTIIVLLVKLWSEYKKQKDGS